MKNKIRTIKVDYWKHSKLSEKIFNIILSEKDKSDDVYDLNCVPVVDKPHFWEFWKWGAYEEECDRIINLVESYVDEIKHIENINNKKS